MSHHIVRAADAETGDRGEKLLVEGGPGRLRVWEHEPAGEVAPEHENPYEYLAYIVSGRMRLTVHGEPDELGPGDSFRIPAGEAYSFEVLEPATVVEVVGQAS